MSFEPFPTNILLAQESAQIKDMFYPFFGAFMQQNTHSLLAINRLLNCYDFENIIELGTHNGGLSVFFSLYCFFSKIKSNPENKEEISSLHQNNSHHKNNRTFYTFDNVIRDANMCNFMKSIFSNIVVGDCLNDETVIKMIKGIIQKPGKTLLICDNGNKAKEFELYGPSLKDGDFILGHDWAFDEIDFAKIKSNGLWNGHELSWDMIKNICINNNIKQVYSELFDKAVWFCGAKIE